MILAAILLIAGCATERSGIGVSVTHCCGASKSAATEVSGSQYETFSVVAEDIPAFLGPLMVSNLIVALTHHGLQPVSDEPDLAVVLRYVQENLSIPRERDNFEEMISTGDSERFAARMTIEIRDPASGTLVWSGYIERLHDVGPGEWMHTGRASVAIYDSFVEVLKDFDPAVQ